MSEKFRDMLGASSMILMMVAVIILGLGIKNILTVLPASAYEDKGVHTFTPIEIYPVQKKNTSSYGRSRRMHPTTTVYKVRYEATDGSGYRCSLKLAPPRRPPGCWPRKATLYSVSFIFTMRMPSWLLILMRAQKVMQPANTSDIC